MKSCHEGSGRAVGDAEAAGWRVAAMLGGCSHGGACLVAGGSPTSALSCLRKLTIVSLVGTWGKRRLSAAFVSVCTGSA